MAVEDTDNHIEMYMHCSRCIDEIPEGESPADFQRLDIGWTTDGFQVWCKRHNINVMHVDFEGTQHPALTSAPSEESLRLQ